MFFAQLFAFRLENKRIVLLERTGVVHADGIGDSVVDSSTAFRRSGYGTIFKSTVVEEKGAHPRPQTDDTRRTRRVPTLRMSFAVLYVCVCVRIRATRTCDDGYLDDRRLCDAVLVRWRRWYRAVCGWGASVTHSSRAPWPHDSWRLSDSRRRTAATAPRTSPSTTSSRRPFLDGSSAA